MADTSWQDLRIAEGKGWAFVGGAWEENKEGIVNPPEVPNVDLLAFDVSRKVEPDVVLWIYEGEYPPNPDARAQFIRVTPEGLEPAREMLPG